MTDNIGPGPNGPGSSVFGIEEDRVSFSDVPITNQAYDEWLLEWIDSNEVAGDLCSTPSNVRITRYEIVG